MVGRTPYEAWVNYANPLREALRCITPWRLLLTDTPKGVLANREYSASINDMTPVPLKSTSRLFLVAGETVRIEERQSSPSRERFQVQPRSYAYGFMIESQHGLREILTFHWNNNQQRPHMSSSGHVHIGRALLAQPTPIRPGDFQNAHVPTGQHSLAAVVRFAITELEVTPLVSDWASMLQQHE